MHQTFFSTLKLIPYHLFFADLSLEGDSSEASASFSSVAALDAPELLLLLLLLLLVCLLVCGGANENED
jgi:hypothetical protein